MPANISQYNLIVGSDTFEVLIFATDNYGLSEDFQFKLQIKTTNNFDPINLINKYVELEIQGKKTKSKVYGLITHLKNLDPNTCNLVMNSTLHPLKQQKHSRNFIQQTLPEIITAVLTNYNFLKNRDYQLKLAASYSALAFIAQKDETDYAFLMRQLNHFGLFFTFLEKQLIITDDINLLPGTTEMPLKISTDDVRPDESAFAFETQNVASLPKTIILKDYNEDAPSIDLTVKYSSKTKTPSCGEFYIYGEHYKTIEEGMQLAKQRMEAFDWQRKLTLIETDCPSLIPGQTVVLTNKATYRLVAIKINNTTPYTNTLTLMENNLPYRHPIRRKPLHGLYYGTIKSSVDYEGNYWVKLKYDEDPNGYYYATRLMQPTAGEEHGFHYPLKPGTEVIISYINGDQNRPVILGAVPSLTMPSPVNVFNSEDHLVRTSAGNQLLLQDVLGTEQLTLATPGLNNQLNLTTASDPQIALATTQGALNINAKQNLTQLTKANHTKTVGADHIINVRNDNQLKVQQDLKQDIQKTTSILANNQASLESTTSELTINGDKDNSLHAEGNIKLNAEHNIVMQNTGGDLLMKSNKAFTAKGKTITFAVGKASFTMDPEGTVTLRGTQVDMKPKQNTQQASKSMLGGTPAEGQAPDSPPEPVITPINNDPDQKKDIIDIARTWEGTPYAHEHGKNSEYAGGSAKKSIGGDCGGITHAIYKEAGYDYGSYLSVAQFVGTSGNGYFEKISYESVKPGDIVIWYNKEILVKVKDKSGQITFVVKMLHHMAIVDKNDGYMWTTHSGSDPRLFTNKGTRSMMEHYFKDYRYDHDHGVVIKPTNCYHYIGYYNEQ